MVTLPLLLLEYAALMQLRVLSKRVRLSPKHFKGHDSLFWLKGTG